MTIPWGWGPSSRLSAIEAAIGRLSTDIRYRFSRLETAMSATQADVDAIATKLGDLKTALTADDAAIQQEIATLQGQGVDVSGLQAALNDLSSQVDATAALVPAAPPADAPPADNGGDTGGDASV